MLSITAGQDPCNILNTSIIGDKTTLEYTTAATGILSAVGTLTTFTSAMNGKGTSNVLTTREESSPFRLKRYLSGGLDTPATAQKTFLNIGLKARDSNGADTGNLLGIVENYIISTSGRSTAADYTYTFSGGSNMKAPLTNLEITNIRNDLLGINADGTKNASKTSLLLRRDELYVSAQLVDNPASINTDDTSLLYLIKIGSGANSAQLDRKKTLEQRNERFFSAFLVEYCFYRVRYTKMLEEYFTIFSQATYTPPQNIQNLFSSSTEPRTPSGTITREQHLQVLTYHMACLKTRMTDMIRILNSINEYYDSIFNEIQVGINDGTLPGSAKSLEQSINLLNQSTAESQKYLTEAQFRQGAMDYTQEKNRHANVLLGLYAFLNLTALAIIFRVANS